MYRRLFPFFDGVVFDLKIPRGLHGLFFMVNLPVIAHILILRAFKSIRNTNGKGSLFVVSGNNYKLTAN